jgi:hypothetical protein
VSTGNNCAATERDLMMFDLKNIPRYAERIQKLLKSDKNSR